MLDFADVAPNSTTIPKLKPIRIGSIALETPVILAPMSGVTDMPFRRLAKKLGAGLVVSEMIASQAMIRECRKTMQMIARSEEENPMAVQLAGCEPEVMAEAARLNEDRGAHLIDINFGCPEEGGQRPCRLLADARRGSCRENSGSDREGRENSCDAQDAHGLEP